MSKLETLIDYLCFQGIDVRPCNVRQSFFDPTNVFKDEFHPLPFSSQTHEQKNIKDKHVESMSLASMMAVLALNVHEGETVLDMCAAPGMKGLYLSSLVKPAYYANDVSYKRLNRMKRLFDTYSVNPIEITHLDATRLGSYYNGRQFDRILIDAPCSGEGVILGGNQKLLETWSSAKVKRLQQLQIKIVKNAYMLLKPGGSLVYATCTLNKNENERVIKKALKYDLSVKTSAISFNETILLSGHGWRILPSTDSIGFFIAFITKPLNSD